ncbi:MAG: lamin tail domain-containing protein [Planctomycetes bacterium]|nr:lamin tail domain-containing protein [Planctomycetota bacterium]
MRSSSRRHALAGRLLFAPLLGCLSCGPVDLHDGPAASAVGGSEAQVEPEQCPDPPSTNALRLLAVKINEVVAINETPLEIADGDVPPAWIEIYNPSDQEVNLGKVPLSDEIFPDPAKWLFPCGPASILPPGGFIVVFLDGDTENPDDLHASFVIDPAKKVTLVLNGGSDVVNIDPPDIRPDVPLGRVPDGKAGALVALAEATPGAPNADPLPPDEPTFIRGDANGDGVVNDADVAALLDALSDPDPNCPDCLDVNDDGKITISDVTFLARALVPGGPAIPLPYPTAGVDPTPDDL